MPENPKTPKVPVERGLTPIARVPVPPSGRTGAGITPIPKVPTGRKKN